MDLTFDEEQQAIAELADRILAERCPPETLPSLEAAPSDERLATAAWTVLAGADLLGLAVPEATGGSGRGVLEAGLVAEQVGRHVALVPYWTHCSALLALARWAPDSSWLSGALAGTDILATALWEPVDASLHVEGDRLHGTLSPVPWAAQARALVVGTGAGVFLVETSAPGVHLVDELAMNREPTSTVHLDGVPALALADVSGCDWLAQRTTALLCHTVVGVCEEALAITARYVSERQQFGSPIGTFQAVAHRCADAYIDTEAIRLTALQASWQLDAWGDAADALAVASFWATDGGHRVVHAAQHLHGGIGVDTDYPVHRYFRWAKTLEGLLGGPHRALLRLGASLAAGEVQTT